MKHLLAIIFVFSSVLCFSQDSFGSDSLKSKRFSIGISTATASLTFWNHIDPGLQGFDRTKARTDVNFLYPCHLSLQYQLNKLFSIRCEVGYLKEEFSFFHEFGYGHLGQAYLDMNYKKEYLSIPLGIRFYSNNRFDMDKKTIETGGVYFQLKGNFDFILKENVNYATTETAIAGPFQTPFPPDWNKTKYNEFHTYKMRYDRTSLTLSIGHEIIKKNFTFFYEGYFEFPPIYIRKTTQPFNYYNYKFSLINIGLSYRF